MSEQPALARGLVRLYPPTWRDRYGEEYLALLDDGGTGPRTVLDALRGAVDAWLRPSAAVLRGSLRLRATVSTVWCAWIALMAGTLLFRQLTEDAPYRAFDGAHAGFGALYGVYIAGAVLSGLAICAGGVPLWWSLARAALAQRRRATLALLAVPLLAPVVFVAVSAVVSLLVGHSPVAGVGIGSGWFAVLAALGLAAGCAGAVAPVVALRRSAPARALLRRAVLGAGAATVTLGLATLASVGYAIGLRLDATDLQPTVTYAAFAAPYLVLMAAALAVAVVSSARGLRALGKGEALAG